ncbi:MAG: hypothetical protein JSS79_15105 [Bacteroidetes bacterium]|nr:hypothetical protein [Bacteroidota bacterium]
MAKKTVMKAGKQKAAAPGSAEARKVSSDKLDKVISGINQLLVKHKLEGVTLHSVAFKGDQTHFDCPPKCKNGCYYVWENDQKVLKCKE